MFVTTLDVSLKKPWIAIPTITKNKQVSGKQTLKTVDR